MKNQRKTRTPPKREGNADFNTIFPAEKKSQPKKQLTTTPKRAASTKNSAGLKADTTKNGINNPSTHYRVLKEHTPMD
ncbi:hypothetical protein OG579_03570 [Williamsia herbipolensis]|uniref:Uncharacterized protein n=1 Tax=Williamsia herbipolensis TaxID=1603258 RepID=A0AAU4K4G8_9NOCA|nr:hypothetical protein [Williamsia herbipolensis]